MRGMLMAIGVGAIVLVLGYGLLTGGLFVAQRSLMYHPTGERPRPSPPLSNTVRVLDLPGHDGIGLFTWWLPPPSEDAPVILYFHGNAGHQTDREERVAAFAAQGWGVLLPTYRYNAGSDGKPSEEALIADGGALLDWLTAQGIDPARVVLFGESLGTGIAVALAAQGRPVAGVVLDSPYDSILRVASRVYWYVPVGALLKDRFESDRRIAQVRVPLLIGHGGLDRIIPERHGRRLFALANEPKRFAYKPVSDHIGLFDHGFFDDVVGFVDALGINRPG